MGGGGEGSHIFHVMVGKDIPQFVVPFTGFHQKN